ncbi:single-stranded-DNA-specific exonuclease RecJ [Tenuibacillus multivorans]|uniref:Single-stranded-DNA-specific exonuclease RecJ n=1 Tax=Tenuibacillus multivorans TaxID=237069 RepID=A0A1G9ZJK9_9BACI|nr:single-stranded-DNA-specific exonuclease RecJ [Tenuibacillus multivorans]GEL77483.1 single-stranded-DNA-specific exonuclease RecJ [Tenuibacillus multivorans]SDN21231.1 single-stranded-DNA-specific exonuclease [Tenuibacillus multivorans]
MLESRMNWNIHKVEETPDIDLPFSSSSVIKRMLVKRGIHTSEDANQFLQADINDLHDPFLFPDMEKAVDRVQRAIQNDEQILIFGDYDADGVTSTAVMIKTLRDLGAHVNYYIPNRFTEGYGPNEQAFREASQAGVDLILTVDTGIAAPNEARIAKQLGMDLIITDHHEEQDEMPDAYAIIHPRLAETYPFDSLAGVGVAFKLAHALLGELPKDLLALAAIGTVADLVPLKNENRIIVKKGLEVLKHTTDPGLVALKKFGKIDDNLTEESIGFIIGPRLNAVGRLQDASLAVDLLLEDDELIAVDMAEEIEHINKERQQIVASIVDEAIDEIEAKHKDDKVILLAKEGWNPGVLGIVASRIVNQYFRPAIVLGIDSETNEAKGSARSIPSYDMFKNGMELRHLFLQFGGHAQAAGMTVAVDHIDDLRRALNEQADERLDEDDFQQTLEIEDEINWDEIDIEFPKQLQYLAPYGMGNAKPYFQMSHLTLREARKIGANKNHVKITALSDDERIEMVGFQLGHVADQLTPGCHIDVVGEIEVNEWNGHRKLQMKIKDLRCLETQLFDFRGQKQLDAVPNEGVVAVTFTGQSSFLDYPLVDYNKGKLQLNEQLKDVKKIMFIDLPHQLESIQEVLSMTPYHSIYACFENHNQEFFSNHCNRDQFKRLYVTLTQHKTIKEAQKGQLAKAKGWTLEQLDFMLQVFFELNFVTMENGDIVLKTDVNQQPLKNSTSYQEKLQQIKVEETLYYSTTKELKDWMFAQLEPHMKEGEIVHGL